MTSHAHFGKKRGSRKSDAQDDFTRALWQEKVRAVVHAVVQHCDSTIMRASLAANRAGQGTGRGRRRLEAPKVARAARGALCQHRAYKMTQLPAYCFSTLAPLHGRAKEETQRVRGRALPAGPYGAPSQSGSLSAGGSFPDSPHPYLPSRVSVHSSSKLARCRIRQLLLRISTDSPLISPTIPPCYSLRRQRSARGCSATRHWDLGPLQA